MESGDEHGDDGRSRGDTIRNPVRDSMISAKSDAKSKRSFLTGSIIRKPKFAGKLTASGFYDDD